PRAMMKQTRIVDADRVNLRVSCADYRPYVGSVRAADANAQSFSLRLEDVWLAPEKSALASFSPENVIHESIESFTVSPTVCKPGESVTVSLAPRLPLDRGATYHAYITSNNPRIVVSDLSLE